MNPLIFADNVTRIVEQSGLSRKAFADKFEFEYKRLCHLIKDGAIRPLDETRRSLEMMCQTYGLRYEDLWTEQRTNVEACSVKMRQVLEIWETVHAPIVECVDDLLFTARVAERFRREEKDGLVKRVRQALRLAAENEFALHFTLEHAVRDWIKAKRSLEATTDLKETEACHYLRHWAVDLGTGSTSG